MGIENYDPHKLVILKDLTGFWVPIYEGKAYYNRSVPFMQAAFQLFYKFEVDASLKPDDHSHFRKWENVRNRKLRS